MLDKKLSTKFKKNSRVVVVYIWGGCHFFFLSPPSFDGVSRRTLHVLSKTDGRVCISHNDISVCVSIWLHTYVFAVVEKCVSLTHVFFMDNCKSNWRHMKRRTMYSAEWVCSWILAFLMDFSRPRSWGRQGRRNTYDCCQSWLMRNHYLSCLSDAAKANLELVNLKS